jgi:hypothetical protein
MSETSTPVTSTVEAPQDFGDAWKQAEALAEAHEAKQTKETPNGENKRDETGDGHGRRSEGAPEKRKPKAETKPEKEVLTDKGEETQAKPEADSPDDDAEPHEIDEAKARSKLEALAKRLGYEIEGDRVSVDERVQLREERRQSKARLRADREAFEAEKATLLKELESNGSKYTKLEQAIANLDLDAIADVIGHGSWDQLGRHYLAEKSSPHAKEMAAVKKQLAEEKAAREKEATARQEAERAAQHERERKEFYSTLDADIADHDDPVVQELAKVEGFRDVILKVERDELEQVNGNWVTCDREESIKRAVDNARKTYNELHAVFGKVPASDDAAPVATPTPGKPAAVKPKPKPGHSVPEFDTTTPEGERRFQEHFAAQMKLAR